MAKKAQGLSIQVIALTTIAVVIIVVMVYLITSRTSIFIKTVEDCKAKNGEPMAREQCVNAGGVPSFEVDAKVEGKDDEHKVCCLFGG